MEDYNAYLKNPEFLSFLEGKGYKKAHVLEEKDVYELTFADGKKRLAKWDYINLFTLISLMHQSKVEKLDPINNPLHFALILYCMILPDMFDVATNTQSDNFVDFNTFIHLMPTDNDKIRKLMSVVEILLSKESPELIVR